jgi:hypothetical protein
MAPVGLSWACFVHGHVYLTSSLHRCNSSLTPNPSLRKLARLLERASWHLFPQIGVLGVRRPWKFNCIFSISQTMASSRLPASPLLADLRPREFSQRKDRPGQLSLPPRPLHDGDGHATMIRNWSINLHHPEHVGQRGKSGLHGAGPHSSYRKLWSSCAIPRVPTSCHLPSTMPPIICYFAAKGSQLCLI